MSQPKWKSQFFTIMAGQTVSLVGSSAVQFALIWWLASETGSPLMMALSGLVAFLPQAILGPFAGVWIDRRKRKTVVLISDMFQGLVAVAFAAAFLIHTPPYWTACLVLGVRAIGSVFQAPAMQALIPQLVPTDELVRVGAWQQFLQSGAFMLGPVLGAIMYGVLPLPVILLSDLLGAIAANLTLGFVRINETPHTHTEKHHFIQEFRDGWKALTTDRSLCVLLLSVAGCMVFFMPLSSYYPLMSSDYFGLSALYGSVVEFTFAAGMMLVSFIVSLFGQIHCKLLMAHLGLLGIGVTTLLSGLVPPTLTGFWIFAVCCGLMGASSNFYSIPMVAYMQESIPPHAQGRVFSLIGSMLSLTMPIGLLVSGPFAEGYGVDFWFIVSGVAITILPLLSLFVIHRLHQ